MAKIIKEGRRGRSIDYKGFVGATFMTPVYSLRVRLEKL